MASSAADTAMSRSSSGMVSPRPMRSRTQSLSSDRPSTISHNLMSPPLTVSPEAAFIAASAASQIVTNDHDSHADTWYDQHGIEPAGETALVSQSALKLVNNFLDQLLFNFLQVSRATTLSALRPAVTEVLKPKLAKDAINNADEELREYLGGADEDDYVQPQGANPSRDWDLELVWKRTRLRCMVYSSLGDMEEEDEDLFMEQENLEIGADEQISDVISPAVAIFLTSVLEYMGELTLTVAGQAAYHRMRAKFEKDLSQGVRDAADIADRIVVEELDMERVALDRTLGRLWRGWKKRIRSPAIDLTGRPFSRSSTSHARHESNVTDAPTPKIGTHEEGDESKTTQEPADSTIAEDVLPADIPLPLGEKDVDEIEVPGLALVYSDDEDDEDLEDEKVEKWRPKSLLINPSLIANGLPTPTLSQPQSPVVATRKRSNSVPLPGAPPFYPVAKRARKGSMSDSESDYGEKDDSATESSFEDAVETTEGSEDLAERDVAAPADEAADETTEKETPASAKKLSKIVTDAAAASVAAGVAVVASVAGVATGKAAGAEGEEAEDDASNYEKAEIMTSSRVSVARSNSPTVSDYSRPEIHKRSSSVHSARLIDVAGPRSPSVSRSPSMDTTERVRPASLSRTSSVSAQSIGEEPRIAKVADAPARTGVAVSTSRSPVDRVRPTLPSATTISESDEEADSVPALTKKKTEPINFSKPSHSSSFSDDASARMRNSHVAFAPGNVKQAPVASENYSQGTKVTILGKTNAAGQFIEEKAPEVPRKASARHATRADTMGSVTLERTRTKDSDEEQTLPLQSNISPRPIHTSGSSASSGTGRLKAVRTSEEHVPNYAENVARNFEELIHSNQTITYTLTPENMRDIDAKHSLDSPIITKFPRKSEEARAAQPRSRSSSTATEVKSASRPTPLSSHPISEGVSAHPPLPSPRATPQKSNRLSNAQARDARVPGESTADFAEFIKSTGPPGETRPLPVRNLNNSSNVNGASSPSKSNVVERRVSAATNRNRYQPREAAVDTKADNSDLIDFIRQGPPSAMNNPRIPRHVAPFRNTMDSEMSGSGGGKAVDATIPEIRYSQASTNVTDNSGPSLQSSVNSSSALINKSKPPVMPSSKMFDDDDMMPKRKQRRVRDPYAIDFSDEEDDDDFMVNPMPPPKKEESLAEFLRNYEPPPEPPAPTPAQKLPKKKASAPSLMGRLTRNYGRDIYTPSSPTTTVNDSRSLNSRTGTSTVTSSKGYVPIQVNMPPGYDKYGPIDNGANRPRVSSAAGSMGRVPMKKFEPREAVSTTSETADLAAFLRSSGPPDVGPGPVRPIAHQEEHNGLSKMFSRRKKAMV